jgi:hypothetical protein
MKDNFCRDLEERTNWVYNDLKAFQFIRLNSLQHKKDNIGGGNISMATLLFIMLSLYSKINYFIERPDKFRDDGTVNEQEAFIKFAKQLKAEGIITSLPENGKPLALIWTGFRDHLVHRLTVENGKAAAAFTFTAIVPAMTLEELMNT